MRIAFKDFSPFDSIAFGKFSSAFENLTDFRFMNIQTFCKIGLSREVFQDFNFYVIQMLVHVFSSFLGRLYETVDYG